VLARRATRHARVSRVFVDETMEYLCTAFVKVLVRVYIQVSIASPSSRFLDMSNKTPSEFAHTMSPTFIQMLHGFPPPDDVAAQYGYGYGEDFEPDYDLLTEAYARQLAHRVPEDVPPPAITLPFLPPPPTPAVGGAAITHEPNEAAEHFPTLPNHTTSTVTQPVTQPVTPPVTPAAPTRGGKRERAKFSPHEIEALARVVYTLNPYGAKHGDKTKAWEEVAAKLKEQGLFLKSSVETVKHKMAALIAYQEVS
jgi:hypothetical protein